MTIKIEKGVPLPVVRQQRPALPLMDMETGDSFWIACEPRAKWVNAQVYRFCVANGAEFKVRREKKGEEPGVRVFCIAI
jgi:hypothetical protein